MNTFITKIKDLVNKLTSKVGANKMHVICSFIITLVFGLIFGIIPGIFIGCLAGIAKEVYDELKFKKDSTGVGFDKSDLIYDAIGIVSATIILVIL